MFDFLNAVPLTVLVLLAIVAGVALAVVFRKVEDKLIEERKKLAQLGKLLGDYGHTIASELCQDVAIGDLPDAVELVESTLKTLGDSTAGPALMQADLISQINAQLAMPGAAPSVLQAVAAFAAANPAVAKAAGLAAIVAAA